MNTSIAITLNKYSSYLTELTKRMKKYPENDTFKNMYQYWSTEYSNLMAYALEPRISDEEYAGLEIY